MLDFDDVEFKGQALDLSSLSAGLEEVREHIAAAFDAVRDLSKEVARLPESTKAIARDVEELAREVEELGRKTEDVSASVDRKVDAFGTSVDRKLDDVGTSVDRKVEELSAALDDRIGEFSASVERKMDEVGTSVGSGLTDVFKRLERVGKVGPALTDLVGWMAGVADRQDRHEAALTRLAEELHTARRRTPLQARAPVISNEQLDDVVARVLAGLAALPEPQPALRLPQPEWEPELPVLQAREAQAQEAKVQLPAAAPKAEAFQPPAAEKRRPLRRRSKES
jgi:uncharacterized protein YoxC